MNPSERGTPQGHRNPEGQITLELNGGKSWEDSQRPRSFPSSLGFYLASLASLLLWLSLLAVMIGLAGRLAHWEGPWGTVAVSGLIACFVLLIFSLDQAHKLTCPLCRGKPLSNQRCNRHRLAERWPLLTYRATIVLKTLFTRCFRCQYCGTPFRLFQKSRLRR